MKRRRVPARVPARVACDCSGGETSGNGTQKGERGSGRKNGARVAKMGDPRGKLDARNAAAEKAKVRPRGRRIYTPKRKDWRERTPRERGLTKTTRTKKSGGIKGTVVKKENGHPTGAGVQPLSAVEWSDEEQKILEQGLQRFSASKMTPLMRYVKIAALLPRKGVRDVALRVRWHNRRDNSKKKKTSDGKKNDKKEKEPAKPSVFSMRPPAPTPPANPPGYLPQLPLQMEDHGADGVGGIGGATGQLLNENLRVINLIRQNIAMNNMHENTELLGRFRDNILQILNKMGNMPGVMSQMPPLPVNLNEELTNAYLPAPRMPPGPQ